jgi:hypothetical protein
MMALPKFLCWKIWLSGDRAIFHQDTSPSRLVAAKALGPLLEVIQVRGVKGHKVSLLKQEEKNWLKDPLMGEHLQPRNIIYGARNLAAWQIRREGKEFQSW